MAELSHFVLMVGEKEISREMHKNKCKRKRFDQHSTMKAFPQALFTIPVLDAVPVIHSTKTHSSTKNRT